jgi:NosR/NirI family nitrous oxide reductase transcriptional regulator
MSKGYFNWLQKDVPVGEVEKYPEIDASGETTVKGIYVIGDLTGIPLLKLAAKSGTQMIRQFQEDSKFQDLRKIKKKEILDFVIVGAGPAGIAAGLEALKHNYEFKILESAKAFNTICNFPKGKPIYAEPEGIEQISDLKINDGVKETLIEELHQQIKKKNLPIEENTNVDNIVKQKNHFEIFTKKEKYKALRVILAIGKTGNSRMLKIPGEHLEKVFNRLIDPQDAKDHDVLVVGGGDSALETAAAVTEYAESVTLSYRKAYFSRPKQGNVEKVNQLKEQGKLKLLLETNVKEITTDKVTLVDKDKKKIVLDNTMIFVLIGKQLPLDFLKKINVKIEGALSAIEKWMFFLLLMFSGVIYFGKSSVRAILSQGGEAASATVSWSDVFSALVNPEFWGKFLLYPFKGGFFENADKWNWTTSLCGIIGYMCFIGFLISGIVVLVYFLKSIRNYSSTYWKTFKYFYLIIVALFFAIVYFGSTYFGLNLLGKSPSFWYTFLYSLTILIFGLRRIYVKPTRYIKRQTWTLILIQVIPLFILPEIILPLMKEWNLLGGENGFLLTQVFPPNKEGITDFGHAYRLILAWPLNIYGLVADNITLFWRVYTVGFSFLFIPILNYLWGKGAYCGWICSCGALAETLGDEYRHLAPHGPKAKKWENAGQWVLLAIFLITGLKLLAVLGHINIPIIHTPRPMILDVSRMIYFIVVDVIFAGVLGVGVYFFMSGRVWCRFFCPLAALMHIYTRFSRYRIFADKKKCISCNICTKVCHMGIDVMSYANKGIPMNDVECVRCSACVVNCPMDVLYFGSQPKIDLKNKYYKTHELPKCNKSKWHQGLT